LSYVAAELIVSGVVQGVGYRYYCLRKANEFGVVGQVSNRSNGSVRVCVEGDRALIETLIVDLKVGPPGSDVRDVAIEWREVTGEYSSFNIEMG
jgi:acylphosphatase